MHLSPELTPEWGVEAPATSRAWPLSLGGAGLPTPAPSRWTSSAEMPAGAARVMFAFKLSTTWYQLLQYQLPHCQATASCRKAKCEKRGACRPPSQTKMAIGSPAALPFLTETIPAPPLTAPSKPTLLGFNPVSLPPSGLGPRSLPSAELGTRLPRSHPHGSRGCPDHREGQGQDPRDGTPVLQSFAGPWRAKPRADAQ